VNFSSGDKNTGAAHIQDSSIKPNLTGSLTKTQCYFGKTQWYLELVHCHGIKYYLPGFSVAQ
jgi:hypothetical protein